MKISFVASEVAPFIKTGGLADVMQSLPKEFAQREEVCVIMPLYSQISEKYKNNFQYLGYFYVEMGMGSQYAGVYTYVLDNVTYYFIDSRMYFDRGNIYGEEDDFERFIFFNKAVIQLYKYLDYKPDIVHANDWHTGLLPLYISEYAKGDKFYENIKTLFTIHNIKYQGIFPWEKCKYILGIHQDYYNEEGIKYYDNINMMKAAIVYCNALTTVSPSYAQELRYDYYSEGLGGLINKYSHKLSGILNGIDESMYNPKSDSNIINYTSTSLEKKRENKIKLQREYKLEENGDIPMFTMVSRLADIKGIDLVTYIFKELMEEKVQFVILGKGEEHYENIFKEFQQSYPGKVAARMYFSSEESSKIYAAGDFFIMPSLAEPCGLSQMIAMKYGNIPIVRFTGGLKDTVFEDNKNLGNGFGFVNINAHELLYTIKRALKTYKTKEFKALRERAMSQDLSWKKSSKEYLKLYEKLVGNNFES